MSTEDLVEAIQNYNERLKHRGIDNTVPATLTIDTPSKTLYRHDDPVDHTVTVYEFEDGDGLEYNFRQVGAGAILFVADTGVTINAPFEGSLSTAGPGSTVTLIKINDTTYDLIGHTEAA